MTKRQDRLEDSARIIAQIEDAVLATNSVDHGTTVVECVVSLHGDTWWEAKVVVKAPVQNVEPGCADREKKILKVTGYMCPEDALQALLKMVVAVWP